MARAIQTAEIEVAPEPDRLEGFPHPRLTPRLFGHGDAERQVLEAVASGRLHHAWLITGRSGIGKATLAYRFARHLLSGRDERDMFGGSLDIAAETHTARLVAGLAHPELMLLRRPYDGKSKRLRTEITVDEVRRLRSFLTHTAAAGSHRVVIIDTADDLNSAAANAVLKSLEEPPAHTVFVLLSAEPGRLLPTIRSRCRRLDLSPLEDDALKSAVTQAIAHADDTVRLPVPAGEDWSRLAVLAGGSVRRALALAGSGGLQLQARIDAALAALPRLDWGDVHGLADDLAGQAAEARFMLFLDLLQATLAGHVRAACGLSAPGIDAVRARRIIGEGRLAAWAGLWETLSALQASADTLNLDRKSLILQMFDRLEAAAAR